MEDKEKDVKEPGEQATKRPDAPSWTSQDLEDAVNRAVRAALKRHKERGESIVVWRDGKIVTLTADEIELEDEEDQQRK